MSAPPNSLTTGSYATLEWRPLAADDARLLQKRRRASTTTKLLLLREQLREHFDFSIFVRADFEVTVKRAEARDRDLFGSIEEVRRRYGQRYVPGQRLYLAEAEPERRASIVVDNDDPLRPLIVRD